ncbi:MAG: hypothetical protein VB070_05690 [Clostridiaceae bacterium]|nr:hypothetical protein [Clostridiaceae bacterium]
MQEMIELKSELDKLIASLNGVLAAKTVLNDQDEIVEIHVLSDLTKSPKQLVRDIQSAVMAALGLDIDYRLISVAQVNSSMITPSAAGAESRLLIRKIMISLDSNNLETTVILGQGDKTYEGSCRGPISGRNRIYSAINACLAALKNYLGSMYNITLLDLQRVTIAGNECFTVALSYVEPSSEAVLYGIAPISGPETEIQSVVMAVLSALNRSISKPRKQS